MRKPALACLVLALASACSSGEPKSQASDAPDETARPVTTIAEAPGVTATTAATSAAPAPTTAAVAATEPPTTTTAAAATTAPPVASTQAPATVTIAVPIETTDLTALPPIEDLEEGEHVGIVAGVDNGTIEFDRVEPLDVDGNGTVDGYQNDNPRLRSVPLPDRVLLDGAVVDRDEAAGRLSGISVLVRVTIVGQRLAAVDQLSVPV